MKSPITDSRMPRLGGAESQRVEQRLTSATLGFHYSHPLGMLDCDFMSGLPAPSICFRNTSGEQILVSKVFTKSVFRH